MAIEYEDKRITCDSEGMTIGGYYFPFATARRVPYRDIRQIDVHTMTLLTGKGRIWGGTFRHWLNLDTDRPRKDRLIVIRTDGFVRPVITPDDVDRVVAILEAKTGLQATRHPPSS